MSHCWGERADWPLRTTAANLDSHMRSISYQALPPTFRDAVELTLELKYNFLWIDTLCIIQGNDADWETESKKMGAVYANAHLTLAASHARNSMQGLFLPRDQPEPWYSMSVSTSAGSEEKHDLFLAAPDCTQSIRSNPKHGFLSRRAWCLQEQILSKRIVWFTDGELVWQCRTVMLSETGLHLENVRWDKQLAEWLWVIKEYSGREMSNFQDRYWAIQGLVNLVRPQKTNMSYKSGTWIGSWEKPFVWHTQAVSVFPKSTFSDWTHQLLWYRSFKTSSWNETLLAALKANSQPSWSWMSMPGPVKFMRQFRNAPKLQEEIYYLRRGNFELLDDNTLRAQVVLWPIAGYTDRSLRLPDVVRSPAFLFDQIQGIPDFEAIVSHHRADKYPSPVYKLVEHHLKSVLRLIQNDGLGPGIQITRQSYSYSQAHPCGWAVFDHEETMRYLSQKSHRVSPLPQRHFYLSPIMTWASPGQHRGGHSDQPWDEYEAPLTQVLILEKIRDKATPIPAPAEAEAKDDGETEAPPVASIPRPPAFWIRGGVFRRAGCGFVYGDAGIGSTGDMFREITIK